MTSENNLTIIHLELWFIPFDILNVICLTLVILLTSFYLIIIVRNKTCHTIPMMLVANSCLAELLIAGAVFWAMIFTLQNDLKQSHYVDSFCIFRGYISYVTCFTQNYSYLLQAIYRYVTVVYPTRLYWQTKRVQLFLVISTWICGIVCTFPHLFNGEIIYLPDDQICQMPLHFNFISIYNLILLYLLPMNGIILIYMKLVRYVKDMGTRIIPVNTLIRAQRELKMVHRIVILVSVLVALGLPYAIFVFMGYFGSPPKYHFRIAYIFINVSLVLIMIIILKFTDPLKTSIINRVKRRQRRLNTAVVPVTYPF